jgi:hypothetical protein
VTIRFSITRPRGGHEDGVPEAATQRRPADTAQGQRLVDAQVFPVPAALHLDQVTGCRPVDRRLDGLAGSNLPVGRGCRGTERPSMTIRMLQMPRMAASHMAGLAQTTSSRPMTSAQEQRRADQQILEADIAQHVHQASRL